MEITQEKAHELFECKDGVLHWKNRAPNLLHYGTIAGHLDNCGYMRTKIKGKFYLNHRLIFLMHHGYFPEIVDHIDGNKINNKIENLRKATKSENCLNKKVRIDSCLKIKNVRWYKSSKKWAVAITINKKRKHIGYFKDLELAELVAQEATNKFYGEFKYQGVLL